MFDAEKTENQPYHHGNVKAALVEEALQLIGDDEAGSITLRRLAKGVGITPAAVYNHFADKDALMLAIKMKIYEEYNTYVESRLSVTRDPEQQLLEICLAYYHFSREHPRQFAFLFSSVLPMEWSTPELVDVACRCLVKTRNVIFQIYQKHRAPCTEKQVVNTTLLAWSQLHGIVTLRNSGSIPAAVAYQDWPQACALSRDEEVEKLIREQLHLMIYGILNSQYINEQH